jgi:nicotinate-nucleotide pyrophosphorylase (carboxylating)
MVDQIDAIIDLALREDIGPGDLTAQSVIPDDASASGQMLLKSNGVISGLDAIARVFRRVDPAIQWQPAVADGDQCSRGTVIGSVDGPARSVLTAERTALNFIQRLSGVATLTRSFVDAVAGTKAQIVDTRKTTPGMRALEKAAVAAGGGVNHRMGLHDAILIKENHVAIAGGLEEAVRRARDARPGMPIEVEARNAGEVAAALASGAERILLDNMGVGELRESVSARDRAGGHAKLEASGGVTLETVGAISATGVDFISVGALTHSAPTLDLSLLLEPEGA